MSSEQTLKKHSQLQAAVTHDFVSNFTRNVKLLYLQDGARQTLLFEKEAFANIGVPLISFSGLPDTILFDERLNRIFLVQAVTVGFPTPISPNRHKTLEALFENSKVRRVYVNAFLDFITFKNFIDDLAQETEVWIAEAPSHLIRFRR